MKLKGLVGIQTRNTAMISCLRSSRNLVCCVLILFSGGIASGALSDSEKCLINRYQTLLVYLLSDKESSIDRKSLRSEVCNFLVIAHYYYQGEPASSEIRRTLIALMDRHEKERKIEGILSDYIKDLVGDGEKIAIERRLRFLGFEGEALAKIIEDIEKNKMSDFSNWAITGDLE